MILLFSPVSIFHRLLIDHVRSDKLSSILRRRLPSPLVNVLKVRSHVHRMLGIIVIWILWSGGGRRRLMGQGRWRKMTRRFIIRCAYTFKFCFEFSAFFLSLLSLHNPPLSLVSCILLCLSDSVYWHDSLPVLSFTFVCAFECWRWSSLGRKKNILDAFTTLNRYNRPTSHRGGK